MIGHRLLPWEYGVRNLFRRPSRTALTLAGLTIVVLLVLIVLGFIRGLEASLAATGNPNVVLVHSLSSAADIENSSIPGRTPSLLSASVDGVQERHGVCLRFPRAVPGYANYHHRIEGPRDGARPWCDNGCPARSWTGPTDRREVAATW